MADLDDVVGKISQYKKYLDKYLAKIPEENKVLYVFKKLSRLAITVEYLQVTGIGKTVNGFRKHEGSIGDTARALVTKWKSLVTSEAPSIKCETVSTTNYHKADTSTESIRAPYIDAPIRKAPYMEQKNLNNCVKSRSDNEASGESCGNDVYSSVDLDKPKCQSNVENKDKHHKQSKEKHGHRSDRGSSEKSHENKISGDAIGDSHKNKGHGSHHKSTPTKTRKSKSHEMSDSDDNGNDDSHGRQKEGELEDKKAERFRNINHTKLKHPRTMEGEDSPDKAPDDAEDVDNGGMSFDDFLNYDASMIKLAKQNKRTHPVEVNKKAASPEKKKKEERKSRSSSSHSKHKQDKSKHSSDKHRSKVKGGSSSRSRIRDGGKTEKRTSAEEFAVPEPKKQVKLTSEDILSTLPETNPNYRPLPQFRPDSPTRHGGGNFKTELIGSKTHTRTQVYSGRRQVFLSAVPTLFDACIKVLIDNIDALDYVGGVPYDILQPVLEKCTPNQLYHLEDCNPAFLSDTDVLWEHHCHQEFKNAKPDEFESWRELYLVNGGFSYCVIAVAFTPLFV
ncbi:hypothetical protein NP493_28g03005 [Ridgeia piscesae]|uniref:TFIIS N-terminal domain-containing protein n=1 Tax=Ridgeia piscesae TaxID=27915 RepID=A0AAD9UK52_RIDPI|nr:hypothetical protein NP493_28g03005 [Ridgeia piscesae]